MMSKRTSTLFKTALCLFVGWAVWAVAISASAGDWPQWRYDAGRTAASPEELPGKLHLQWVRHLPAASPAWPRYPRLCFDAGYEPVVMGGTMFVPSTVTDSVTALATDTGAEKWRFYTDGPVRLAPVAFDGKVCFVSDDGYLYCLDAADGKLLWKCRGLPPEVKDRKVLGNDRLISLWPARGGPVLADGKIYFGAGVWPFEGVYVCAVDAATGELIWRNEDIGNIELGLTDHSMRQDAGISPQGYLAVIGDKLFVPSGRALPGELDLKTGALGPYLTGWGGRDNLRKGCWYVAGTQKYLFQSGEPCDLASGARLHIDPANEKELGEFRELVLTEDAVYFSQPLNQVSGYRPAGVGYESLVAWDITKRPALTEWKDQGGRKWKTGQFDELWSLPTEWKVQIKAGGRLYGGARGTVAAWELTKGGRPAKVAWKAELEGTPSRMLAADGKLFVVTLQGAICAYGAKKAKPRVFQSPAQEPDDANGQLAQVAARILKAGNAKQGYCLTLGIANGRLAAELAKQSNLHVIVLAPDADNVQELRTKFTDAGLYGSRIAVYQGDAGTYPLPPYFANLVVARMPADDGEAFAKQVIRSLHPYGGVACLAVASSQQAALAGWVDEASGIEMTRADGITVLRRVGAPAGAADWTHEDADAGNSLVSRDQRVKGPLNVLWFGGAVDTLYPDWDFTHSRSTTPLVAGGRMFFQVFPNLHAVDIYTGRHLWSAALPGMDADAKRSNVAYAVAEESLYLVDGKTCVRLDVATGSKLSEIPCPGGPDAVWRDVRIWNDSLIGSTGKDVVCLDRLSGEVKWKHRTAGSQVRFAVGGGRVFCADVTLPDRRGNVTRPEGKLVTLDVLDGNQVWQAPLKLEAQTTSSEKPPWLGLVYSEANDILIAAYHTLSAYDGKDGTVLWSDQPLGNERQPMLHRDRLITQSGSFYDPRTARQLPGEFRNLRERRGCTRVLGGEHLLAIRDAHASYWDLATGRQTFFRGVRSGCTNCLIPAGGLLNAPNFAHGCACNYSMFASYALIHLPGVER